MPSKRKREKAEEPERKPEASVVSSSSSSSSSSEDGAAAARARAVRECPYLDTVNRHVLDFDFEKVCSVTLSAVNVYACLVCGRFFAGRGAHTPCYAHALESNHRVYVNLHTLRFYCLPDNYEVEDASLADVRFQLQPRFTPADVAALDANDALARAVDGTEFLPGLVGLNNVKHNDAVNVVVQLLNRVSPLRDHFLAPGAHARAAARSPLVARFGELVRKLWNPRNFRSHVSPHELLQAVSEASGGRFPVGERADPHAVLLWMLNALHKALAGDRHRVPGSSIIHECFQGAVELQPEGGTPRRVPFLALSLDVPSPPLFKDSREANIIPKLPFSECWRKYDGDTASASARAGGAKATYRLRRLPRFLIVHLKRFTDNQFYEEKNHTIIVFPLKKFDLAPWLDAEATEAARGRTRYDLLANIRHTGKPGEGDYRVHLYHKSADQWFDVQDLVVESTIPQLIPVSEGYILLYARRDEDASAAAAHDADDEGDAGVAHHLDE